MEAFRQGDYPRATQAALEALAQDERNGDAWLVLGAARTRTGDLDTAMTAYEAALALAPERIEIANDLGQIAHRLHRTDEAAHYFALYHAARPGDLGAVANLANVLRERHQFDEAIALLRPAIQADPQSAALWNALGAVLDARCDPAAAATFFQEALRLDPRHASARSNLAIARLSAGDAEGALQVCNGALADAGSPGDLARTRMIRSTTLFVLGRIGEAWDDYEARLDPAYPDATRFLIDRPRWDLKTDLRGRSILLFGEQGLGDQFRFAGTVPDLLQALGPDGRLTIAVEERLIPLFRRTYAEAEVIGLHKTVENGRGVRFLPGFDATKIDLWTPMASPMGRFRRNLADYPPRAPKLLADPRRVAHWRGRVQALAGLKVGLLWKSLTVDGARSKFFSPFDRWAPIVRTAGVSFVNLQYGDSTEELRHAREAWGVDIWTPPEVDLRNDLDEVAAIACALDLVVGPENSATSMICACAAPTWIVAVRDHWHCQGTDGYPWYPSARAFNQATFGDWDEPIGRLAAALAEAVGG